MKTEEWHDRFIQQAGWTAEARSFILNKIRLPKHPRILEIGSGTGAVLDSYQARNSVQLLGLDIHLPYLLFNKIRKPAYELINADGFHAPFQENCFDFTYCHYLLLWIENPIVMLQEMKRITRNKGWVACFAEPDYAGRIDYPEANSKIGQLQNESLSAQGARIDCGRQIAHQLHTAGFSNVTWGIIGAHRALAANTAEGKLEKDVLKNDLKLLGIKSSKPAEINENIIYDDHKFNVQFVPTFYAYAQNIE